MGVVGGGGHEDGAKSLLGVGGELKNSSGEEVAQTSSPLDCIPEL